MKKIPISSENSDELITSIDTDGKPIQGLTSTRGPVFDFQNYTGSFARDYLNTYYTKEVAVDEYPVTKFLVEQYPRIRGASRFLEIGCGPTIHHVLPVVPYVHEIHMADYLQENLDAIFNWKMEQAGSHNWNPYTYLTLKLENAMQESIEQREQALRKKIARLLPCNLMSDEIIPPGITYPAVGAFYCVEEVGITTEGWTRIMTNLSNLIDAGGYLFLCSLMDTDSYSVISQDTHFKFPCLRLKESDYMSLLPSLGFSRTETIIESSTFTGDEERGVKGVILVAAKKDC